MTWAAATTAGVLVVWATWGYLGAVGARTAHPRLASWLIWTFSMGVAAAGAARVGQWAAVLLPGAGSLTAAAVLVAGWRHGDREHGLVDYAGVAVGGTGVVMLAVGLPGWVAVAVSVAADLAAFAPTYVNCRAGGEPVVPWLKLAAAAGVALTAASWRVPAGWIFPVYELAACSAAAGLALGCCARMRLESGLPGADQGVTPPATKITPLLDADTLERVI